MNFRFLRRAPKLAAGQLITVAGHPVRLRVNARAKRVGLRVDAVRREVVATAPSERVLPDALAFAQSRAPWIAAQLTVLPPAVAFRPGVVIEAQGAPLWLERAATRTRARIVAAMAAEPARLIASGEDDAYARGVERALRGWALDRLIERTALHCAALAQNPPPVTLTAAKGRWGSCRSATAREAARIRYNWRLILCLPEVLDYVAAHEVAHLVEANHGPAFWKLVERLYGRDPRPARAWLRANGQRLLAIG